ncbi:thiamine pyrophosphate-binding protein [Thermus scotoductus]|uniref:thiamine pyrophosphate-binding protein n=1 Tax=Thermus scotoductus TaxID=37636 RepID=UPI0020A25ADA|nr:thiamine pyrophosphate-binding protein [Thermus scotoductus]
MRLTVAQALVRFLAVQWTERDGQRFRLIRGVFGIFGHGNLPGLGEALLNHRELDLPFYRFQNEQAMVHTAIAYANYLDRLSTFACTASIGHGATNMVTGAAAATINRLPVLLLPADSFANRLPDPIMQQMSLIHT